MTYKEWQDTKEWLKVRVKNGDLTQEEADTYFKITKMMHGKRAYKCLECRQNDGNFSKCECYNCPVWGSF